MSGAPGVEDPIGAIFDLSDRAAQMAPTVRRMFRYTATIVVLWVLAMFVLALIWVSKGNELGAILSAGGFLLGIVALGLLWETDRFFQGFVQRHRAIRMVRDAEPVVKIPEGRTPLERLARHLAQSNPKVADRLQVEPTALRYKVELPGKGRKVGYDLMITQPGGTRWNWTGGGDGGFVLLARSVPEALTLEDLQRAEAELREVTPHLPGAPARLLLLRAKGDPLAEPVYEYAVGHPVNLRRKWEDYRVSLEIVTERPDGTYDFIPNVVGVP